MRAGKNHTIWIIVNPHGYIVWGTTRSTEELAWKHLLDSWKGWGKRATVASAKRQGYHAQRIKAVFQ